MRRIQEEVLATRDAFEAELAVMDWVMEHIIYALDVLEANPQELDETFIVATYVAAHKFVGHIKRDVYDEILSVGALGKIQDVSDRSLIQQFYQLEQVHFDMGVVANTYQSDLRRALPHDVISLLRAQCSAVYTDREHNEKPNGFRGVRSECSANLNDEQVERALDNLTAAQLKPSLRQALSDYRNKQLAFKKVIDHANRLYADLAPLAHPEVE